MVVFAACRLIWAGFAHQKTLLGMLTDRIEEFAWLDGHDMPCNPPDFPNKLSYYVQVKPWLFSTVSID